MKLKNKGEPCVTAANREKLGCFLSGQSKRGKSWACWPKRRAAERERRGREEKRAAESAEEWGLDRGG